MRGQGENHDDEQGTYGRDSAPRSPLDRAALGAAAVAVGLSGAASAQDLLPVKFSLDWAFQGPQAPFLLALERGYFEEEGLDVTMDRGYGSGDVPVKVAAGTYDIGVADINPTIRLNAESPDSDLIAVRRACSTRRRWRP